jgi:hypothetical protein
MIKKHKKPSFDEDIQKKYWFFNFQNCIYVFRMEINIRNVDVWFQYQTYCSRCLCEMSTYKFHMSCYNNSSISTHQTILWDCHVTFHFPKNMWIEFIYCRNLSSYKTSSVVSTVITMLVLLVTERKYQDREVSSGLVFVSSFMHWWMPIVSVLRPELMEGWQTYIPYTTSRYVCKIQIHRGSYYIHHTKISHGCHIVIFDFDFVDTYKIARVVVAQSLCWLGYGLIPGRGSDGTFLSSLPHPDQSLIPG